VRNDRPKRNSKENDQERIRKKCFTHVKTTKRRKKCFTHVKTTKRRKKCFTHVKTTKRRKKCFTHVKTTKRRNVIVHSSTEPLLLRRVPSPRTQNLDSHSPNSRKRVSKSLRKSTSLSTQSTPKNKTNKPHKLLFLRYGTKETSTL